MPRKLSAAGADGRTGRTGGSGLRGRTRSGPTARLRRVTGALLGGLALVLLAGTGALVAATLQVRRFPEFVLAAYVVAYGSMVALCLLLSLFVAMTRSALIGGSAAILLGSVVVWLSLGARRPPRFSFATARVVTGRGPVLLLVMVVALALSYVVALMLGTPPNGSDQLNYHLPRAAFWLESDRVGYVRNAYDQRTNSF